jgi:hypothetical protein
MSDGDMDIAENQAEEWLEKNKKYTVEKNE